jgi:hypothetical protein
MIATVLGFVTALVMAVLGTQWYIMQRRQLSVDESPPPAAHPASSPPLVPLEVAEQLMQAPPVAEQEVAGEVETWEELEETGAPLEESPGEAGEQEAEMLSEPDYAPESPAQGETPVEDSPVALEVAGAQAGQASDTNATTFSGYCNRCRDRRFIAEYTLSRTASGRPSVRGECPECGAGMFVFISEEEWEAQQAG